MAEKSPESSEASVPGASIDPGLWQPRQTVSAQDVARYTRFVKTMKMGLPALAALLLGVVIVYPLLEDRADSFRTDLVPTTTQNPEALSMMNARYFGTDNKGQPFSITAAAIDESNGTEQDVILTTPQADISLTDGTWVMLGAETGIYHRDTENLELTGDVNLFQDQGHELHTAEASMDLEAGVAQGNKPVVSQGPFGQLAAEGFRFDRDTKTVMFTGPAKLTLIPGGGS